MFLSFLIPALFLSFLQVHPFEMQCFQKRFSPSFGCFLEGSKPTFKYNSFHLSYITLQMNVFIASDEIISTIHLREYDITL